MALRRCSGGHDADDSEFSPDRGNPGGLRYACRACEAKKTAARRAQYLARNAARPDDFEITVEPPPKTLAEEHQEAKARRTAAADLRATLEENARLRDVLAAAQALHATPADPYAPAPPTRGDAVACLVASDWHVEEPVEASKVHGLNEYNLTVAEARARAFFQNGLRLTDITARDADVKTIYLALLGDFITGHIHEELRETNELGPAEAAQVALGFLVAGIEFLLRESDYTLEIDCVPGNHGRMTAKPRIANATETSLETFMYHSLAGRFYGNPRVHFRVANSKMLYRRFFERFNMRLIHGDDIKFGGGVGGVTIPIRKKLAAWNPAVRADLTVMGHFHQRIDGGDFIVNGSLIGYNEFAQAIGASPEEAQQQFFLIHARGGGQKSLVAPIWLDMKHHQEKP